MTRMFVAPSKTILSSGMKKSWIIANVPCIIVHSDNDFVTLKPYDLQQKCLISKKNFDNFCKPVEVTEQFLKDFHCKPFNKNYIMKACKECWKDENQEKVQGMLKLVGKAYQDAYTSAGSAKCIKIPEYEQYTPKENSLNRFSPILNRRSRNSHSISNEIEYTDNFDPAPFGIRPIDFATKEEQNKIFRALMIQICKFKGALSFSDKVLKYLQTSKEDLIGTHICKYCNESMNIDDYIKTQKYSAKKQYVNFCHDDPSKGTKHDNVYFGHNECNSKQGGYSIKERLSQSVELLENNPFLLDDGLRKRLEKCLNLN